MAAQLGGVDWLPVSVKTSVTCNCRLIAGLLYDLCVIEYFVSSNQTPGLVLIPSLPKALHTVYPFQIRKLIVTTVKGSRWRSPGSEGCLDIILQHSHHIRLTLMRFYFMKNWTKIRLWRKILPNFWCWAFSQVNNSTHSSLNNRNKRFLTWA